MLVGKITMHYSVKILIEEKLRLYIISNLILNGFVYSSIRMAAALRSHFGYYENPYISHLIEKSNYKTKGIKSRFMEL